MNAQPNDPEVTHTEGDTFDILTLNRVGITPGWTAADVATIALPVVLAEWRAAVTGPARVQSISIGTGYGIGGVENAAAWEVRIVGTRPHVEAEVGE